MAHPQFTPEQTASDPAAAQTQISQFGGAPETISEALIEEMATRQGATPSLMPPTEKELQVAEEGGIAAWHTGMKITALWSNDSNRNAYISVPGLGWKKISNANDNCVVTMIMLASHAEQLNANVNLRVEADGMVHEIYVW